MQLRFENVLRNPFWQYALLLVLIYFVVFFKLGSFPFRLWDESMFAVNAYEMEKNGNYMVPFFDNGVDWRNSKPLLLTWIQVGFIKIFGFNELSIRLPSAISVSISILILFHFLRQKVDHLFAWIASLILLTCIGYIGLHTGRTGDADALLSFFILATCIFFLKWLLEEKNKFLLVALTFFSLAVMTKSFAAFLFIPGLMAFGIFHLRSRFFSILKLPTFYLGLGFFFLSLFIVFYLREIYQPGFLNYTFSHDAGRLGAVIETHSHGWDFYILNIFYDRFSFWTIPFLLGAVFCFQIKQPELKIISFFALTITILYLIPISFSTTKLLWYDMPLYPFLAVIAAIPIHLILTNFPENKKQFFLILAVIILFLLPYRKMFYLSQSNEFSNGDKIEEVGSLFLSNQIRDNKTDDLTIYHYGYRGSILCYKYIYADKGKTLRITYTPDFVTGEKVFVSNDSLKNSLVSQYNVDTISTYLSGLIVKIK